MSWAQPSPAAGAPADKAQLYRALELEARFHHVEQKAIVGAILCGVSTDVRGRVDHYAHALTRQRLLYIE